MLISKQHEIQQWRLKSGRVLLDSSGVKFKCEEKVSIERESENKVLEWNGRMKRESTINLRIMRERVVYKKLKQQNNKFNCFLVRLLSYIRSCFLFHCRGHGLCLPFFFVLLQFAGIENKKIFVRCCLEWKVMLNFQTSLRERTHCCAH